MRDIFVSFRGMYVASPLPSPTVRLFFAVYLERSFDEEHRREELKDGNGRSSIDGSGGGGGVIPPPHTREYVLR